MWPTTLIKYTDTFISLYLFPSLNLKHPEGRNPDSFIIIFPIPGTSWVLNKYLLNKGMTIHHLENIKDQPMDRYPLNERMSGLHGGLNTTSVPLLIYKRRVSDLLAATDQVSVADAGLEPGP